ncbi:hypothetical protein [Streptomyces exfoliatus]|uniref:hypothetical protein n=1 Tax=Streptomyces exfoliatus TaxID=1905 RepID=UPI00069163F8|nr:hypothetical protein [Streptomyces exfoliatus]
MTDRTTPTGPPPGPQWGQPIQGSTGGRRRSVLTHSLAALGGLAVGVLLGIVGTGNGSDSAGSQPPASPTTTESPAELPPPARTTPEAAGTAKTAVREIPGDGTFLVGQEVRPGTYRSTGPTDSSCYWARLKGTTGDSGEIIANGASKGPSTVTVLDTDKAFQTSGCQTWKHIG